MSVKAIQEKIAAGQSASQLSGNTSLNKFKQHLQKNGLSPVALKFLSSKAGKAGAAEFFAAALAWAKENDPSAVSAILNLIKDGTDSPGFLTDALEAVHDQEIIREAYDLFKDQASYRQILLKNFSQFNLGQIGNYYQQAGVEDLNHNGTIEADEPGYDQKIDLNQDQLIDLSEITAHIFSAEDAQTAHSFSQVIEPLRSSVDNAFRRSYTAGKQGEQYLNTLNIVISGDFSPEVQLTANWLKTDYLAKQAASAGDLTGALAIYEAFAQETGIEPGGLYTDLKNNEQHLPFVENYFSFYMYAGATSDYGDHQMNGVEFLHGVFVSGGAFNLRGSVAKSFLKSGSVPEKYQSLFWKPSRKANVDLLSSTQLDPDGVFEFTIDQPPSTLVFGANRLSMNDMGLKFNLDTGNWAVTMQGGDIYARAGSADLSITAQVRGREIGIADLHLTHAENIAETQSAPLEAVQANMISTLQQGGTITSTMIIAPDSDDMISWEAVTLDGGWKGITSTKLAERFCSYPDLVVDQSTERGQQIYYDLIKIVNNPKKIQAYVDQNLTAQEKLRFFRLGDMFIGGGMGPYQHLEASGYYITNVEQTGEGDPCILRITAEKRIPISELTGEMKAAYDALPPEVQAQYANNSLENNPDGTLNLIAPDQSGIPVQVTVEIYSTTSNAVLATGSHLSSQESHIVGFQTHAPNSWGMDHEENIAAGNIPTQQNGGAIAYLPLHCHTEQFKDPLISQFGGNVWIGPGVGADNSAVAHFNILMETQEALITGHNTLAAAKKAYKKAGGPNQGAYTEGQGSAIAKFTDSDNDQLPDLVDQTQGQSTVVYDPINNQYIADGNVTLTNNNLLDSYLGELDNVSTQFTPTNSAETETVVAKKKEAAPATEPKGKQVAQAEGSTINAML